jgi:hypothetical protein
MSTLTLSSILSRLVDLTDESDVDLFAPEVPARGLLAYPALAEYLAPAEYAAWSAANLDDAAAADSASERHPYDREAHAARCRDAGAALEAALRASPALGSTLRRAVRVRCQKTGAELTPAMTFLAGEGL